jgi:alcohol dehydrogenase (cytochrome c)
LPTTTPPGPSSRRRRAATAVAAILSLAAAVALPGCGSRSSDGSHPVRDVGWTSFGGTPDGARFSALAAIDRGSVARLGVAWTLDQDRRLGLWETYPVVVGRTMYLTTNTGEVLAVDARTGRRRWSFAPTVDFLASGGGPETAPVNRGVAVGGGRVYLLTYDEQLIALRAATGAVLWRTQAADPGQGYVATSPPTYSRGRLYLGSSGSDAAGTRGFVAAFDAATGRRRWRTSTVPPPGRGGVPAGGGGGRVWMPPTVDARTATVYAGTGNPSPALTSGPRHGCIRWASGLVALDARTGGLRWGASEVCPDLWDYDGGQPPLVYDARVGGRRTRTVAHANKSGAYTLRDAATGTPLAPPADVASDPVAARRTRPRPDAAGRRICPGAFGGVPYSPAALDPRGRTLYQPTVELCMIYRTGARQAGGPRVQLGGGSARVDPRTPARGALVAVDADTGAVRWRRRLPAPMVGGALATAGGLVFSGCDDGNLYAFDTGTGAVRWRGRVGTAIGSAPLTYRIDGVQYVAIVTGGSSIAGLAGTPGRGRLTVLRLGGRALPVSPPDR